MLTTIHLGAAVLSLANAVTALLLSSVVVPPALLLALGTCSVRQSLGEQGALR
ncbi:hypothetical protein TBR22_A52330 [Luteitalea sp. TBR-22]|uniref:hypothetical protein n=1 Tax=Luteitalea sp. TBR-22 TaxID=2802971 RepID=UPI001AF6FAA6|nr:hypothetical protein [Luteitalea sp. TBR-22]BCS35996.1 hypothetical protein TBR22_A52330 [Luteitalea sp. TBR-22]